MRVHRIRQIQGYLGDREMTHKLVNEVAPRYTERNGGYTRILKLGGPRGRQRPDGSHRARLTSPNPIRNDGPGGDAGAVPRP